MFIMDISDFTIQYFRTENGTNRLKTWFGLHFLLVKHGVFFLPKLISSSQLLVTLM